MSENLSSKQQIAKNTLLLYVRMFVTMLIGLFTSRIVLQTLGVSDFGVYNVVGGIVSMMTFLNSALAASAQRFFSYELGRDNYDELKKLFSTTILIYLILALLVVALLETGGLWFLNHKLNINPNRLSAANWVFQCSLVILVVNMVSAPYNAILISHERMGVFAYISIFESILKLSAALLLFVVPLDKLIIYALFQVAISIIIRCCYSIYCKTHFEETRISFVFEKRIFNQLFSFSGWSLIGNIGFTLKDPLSNVIFNLFCGTVVNAARGVALQVNSLVCAFSANLGMALNPSIVKYYSAGENERSRELVFSGARISFFLISIIAIPVILNIDFLLNLWLGADNVPQYTAAFLVIIILVSLIQSLSATSSTAVQATGHIKYFSIGVCVIPLMELPLSYLLLFMGMPPYIALLPAILINFLTLFFRYYILKHLVPSYEWRPFLVNVVLRSCFVFAVAFGIGWGFSLIPIPSATVRFFALSTVCIIISCCLFFLLGLNQSERTFLLQKIIDR